MVLKLMTKLLLDTIQYYILNSLYLKEPGRCYIDGQISIGRQIYIERYTKFQFNGKIPYHIDQKSWNV